MILLIYFLANDNQILNDSGIYLDCQIESYIEDEIDNDIDFDGDDLQEIKRSFQSITKVNWAWQFEDPVSKEWT